MKYKEFFQKILSLTVSSAILLTGIPFSTMAAELGDVPYTKTGIVDGYTAGNGLSLAAFKALYANAQYAAVETFEDTANYTPSEVGTGKAKAAEIDFYPIIGENGTPVTGAENSCTLTLDRGSKENGHIDDTVATWHTLSSGNNALYIGNIPKGLALSIGEIESKPNLTPVAFGWALTGSGSGCTLSINVTYSNGDDETISLSLKGKDDDETQFVGFKAPEGAYITNINIPSNDASRAAVVDDIAVVFEEQPAVATSMLIEGDNVVYTPVYGVKVPNKYQYTGYVLDQGGRKMREEEVTLSISGENDAISFESDGGSGILAVSEMESVPTELKIIAQSNNYPGISPAELSVAVENVSYYNEAFIGDTEGIMVGEETAARDENDDTGDSTVTRAEFVGLLDSARTTSGMDMTMINFVSDDLTVSSGVASMPLHQSGQKFSLGTAARRMSLVEIDENGNEGDNGPMAPTAGNRYYSLASEGAGGNEFIMDTDMLGDLEVTAMGFVVLARDAKMTISKGFRVIATYSNGKKGYFSQDIKEVAGVEAKRENNVFFGIKAPPGHYITNVKIVTSAITPSAYGRLDEFGFVFEVPDIKRLEKDYSQLTFSDISDENMQRITKNLNLTPYSSIGSSTIAWSTNPAEVIAQDGTLTPPDIPTAEGYTPRVDLIATFESGALKKEKIFELFVPSKLELDRDAITVPSEVSADITLPTLGAKYGSTITWSASANSPVDTSSGNLGKVTRPQDKDKYVLLTATISNPSGSITKDFGVTVKAINPAPSGGGTGGGGGGGGGGGAIAAPTVIPPQKTPVEVKPTETDGVKVFNDLAATHWAHERIMELYEKGIVNGTGENSFEPEGDVTRDQYLAMLIRAFGFETEKGEASFTDVSEDEWYYDIIMTAQKLGITDGYADGSFGVGRSITREEMAVMAYRSAEKAGLLISKDMGDTVWNDAGEISEFATEAVSALNKAGIIKGISEDEFSPKTTATRAQAAVIISRILEVSAIEK